MREIKFKSKFADLFCAFDRSNRQYQYLLTQIQRAENSIPILVFSSLSMQPEIVCRFVYISNNEYR